MRYEKKKILRLFNSLSFFYLFFDFFFSLSSVGKRCQGGEYAEEMSAR
ncbi:hypothetical protein AWRI1631_131440 [Saccharomyces cerevisiae AWRI1631]|uniref:Uncharacterized protein n=1 Tax=Saccharomyces cerevisiae (strain AWRI1631) TaxID=545124 RepID=B5VPD1_YEAS6|nr:hypothetical protein AWRI1631_131440 [Saccharomyces cerevisiae AWRI1631]